MIVFKAFLKILARNKAIILLYTGLLVVFGGFIIQNDDMRTDFENTRPDIVVLNHDDGKIAAGLVEYLQANAEIKDYDDAEKLDDALFYREVNSIIEIPAGFSESLISGEDPRVKIRNTGDYNSSLAEMLLQKYLNIISLLIEAGQSTDKAVENAKLVLADEVEVNMQAGSLGDKYAKANRYFSFAAYSILACLVYVICLVMSSFKNRNIRRRNLISATSYQKLNRELFAANCVYAVCLWLVYLLISFVLVGTDSMWSLNGLFYALNALVFTINATALAFLISNIVSNREAISGIVNVVALGSAFLCGSFVPMEWLPDSVLSLAHILPAYWYNSNNDLLAKLSANNSDEMTTFVINLLVMIGFTVGFIVISNLVSRKKQRE